MVDTSVYGKDERCEFRIYGELDRADQTADEGVEVGMEVAVLIFMDGMAHFAQGDEVMLPKLGAADAMAESQNPEVGRMTVWIMGTAGHIGDE